MIHFQRKLDGLECEALCGAKSSRGAQGYFNAPDFDVVCFDAISLSVMQTIRRAEGVESLREILKTQVVTCEECKRLSGEAEFVDHQSESLA